MGLGTLTLITLGVGSAFCAVMCGAVLTERSGASSAEDMHEMFDFSPDAV